jgi:hypothetical protein
VTRRGTPVTWNEQYIRTGHRERIEVEQITGGMAHTLGSAPDVEAAQHYINKQASGEFRIVRVTHQVVETIRVGKVK